MIKLMQSLICGALLVVCVVAAIDARPQNVLTDNNQDLDSIGSDVEEARNAAYYDLPSQSLYPSIPLDRLQMLLAQYRPNAYLRSPTWNTMNDLYRTPESKRQVRYRQCYFNPISCFKK